MTRQQESVKVSDPLRAFMHSRGWMTFKTAGSKYMQGWPDLYCIHPKFGTKWVECKMLGKKLRPSQKRMYQAWTKCGVGVWVINHKDDYPKLFDLPNWWKYV